MTFLAPPIQMFLHHLQRFIIQHWIVLALIAIGFCGSFLHIVSIAYPDTPVFDEAHFATYSSQYATGRMPIDIHPPLGKLIYAGVLTLVDPLRLHLYDFLKLVVDQKKDTFTAVRIEGRNFQDFPFVPLRLTHAFFGTILPIIFFWFLVSVGIGELPAIFAAIALLFENAFLLDGRLILLNGPYLLFSLVFLTLFFLYPKKSLLPGVFLGLALSVKLIAVVFLFPVVVFALFFQTSVSRAVAVKRLFNIFFVSMTVLTLSYGTHWTLFSTNNRLQTWSDLGIVHFDSSIHPKPPLSYFEKPAQHLAASILDVSFSLYGYVTPTDSSSAKSFWYEWPFNKGSFDFFRTWQNKLPATIALAGNPIVLLLSTTCVLFVFLGILILVISRGALVEKIMLPSKHSVLFFLISGYLFSLMPFMIVPRATYLYHYFPAYLFAIGIFSFLVDYLFVSYLRSRSAKFLFSFVVILFIIFGFVYQSPTTYGYSGDGIFASFLSFF